MKKNVLFLMAFAKSVNNSLRSEHQSCTPYLAPPTFFGPSLSPASLASILFLATPLVAPSARLLRLPRPSPAPLKVPNLFSTLWAPPLVPPLQ